MYVAAGRGANLALAVTKQQPRSAEHLAGPRHPDDSDVQRGELHPLSPVYLERKQTQPNEIKGQPVLSIAHFPITTFW
jgi:hypothetical protein